MPSFASGAKQASKATKQMAAHGNSRAATRHATGISSIGTERSYQQSLGSYADWLSAQKAGDLRSAGVNEARAYLAERAENVAQATLDRDRQAIEAWLTHRDGVAPGLERTEFQAATQTGALAEQSRVYTQDQIDTIKETQTEANAIATQVAHEAGLRASELHTIQPASQASESPREWRDDRHLGREGYETYVVSGKGGLEREVTLSPETSTKLEGYRLEEPKTIEDRGIHAEKHYAIGGGQSWSQSFSDASERELGWSAGAHALRHEFAQERMETYQQAGYEYDDAREVVAQELGHWRPETVETYLR